MRGSGEGRDLGIGGVSCFYLFKFFGICCCIVRFAPVEQLIVYYSLRLHRIQLASKRITIILRRGYSGPVEQKFPFVLFKRGPFLPLPLSLAPRSYSYSPEAILYSRYPVKLQDPTLIQ